MATVNVRESLRKLDEDTSYRYDLLTMYDSCPLLDNDKKIIARMLYDKEDPEVIYDRLQLYLDDDIVSDLDSILDNDTLSRGKYESFIDHCVEKLAEIYDYAQYNEDIDAIQITQGDRIRNIKVNLFVDSKFDNYQVSIDEGAYDIQTFDTENDAIDYVVSIVNQRMTNIADEDNIDDEIDCCSIYDVVENNGQLTAKGIIESTNELKDIDLGKINTAQANELLNSILNNPNYKISADTISKINNNSAPWGLAVQMVGSVDVDGTNGLLAVGDIGGDMSVAESAERSFDKGSKVTDGKRNGTVLDYDSEKILVDWNTNDIEWVNKDAIRCRSSVKEDAIENGSEKELQEITEASEDEFDLKQLSFKDLMKNYNNYTTFKDIDENSGLIRDLCDDLENKGVSYYLYNHVKDNGVTIFYDDFDIVEDFDVDDIVTSEQEFDSAATSINSNKLPAIYKLIDLKPGSVVVDFGGGKFDNAVEYLKDKDVTLLVYDPYNRSAEHNKEVLEILKKNGGADAAINSNVLNVIKEPSARHDVLQNISKITKKGAPIYITVYEGRGDNNEGPTKAGYQLNRKTADYLDEIQDVFSTVTRKGKLITAINESLKEDFKTYYVSYKENKGKFKGKYVSLPIRANSKEEAEKKFLEDHPDIKFYDYKIVTPEESLNEGAPEMKNKSTIKKELEDKVYNAFIKLALSPTWGYDDKKEVEFYIMPKVKVSDYTENDFDFKVEFRAELSYSELAEACETLDDIVMKYDENAYFEPVQPGIAAAFITLPKNINESVREYTNKLLDMVDEGMVDKDMLIRALVNYMSEDDVKDFVITNDYDD